MNWPSYDCEDYLSSELAQNGYWDAQNQLWVIEPAARVQEDAESNFLEVGRPGVDNIGFGYRKGESGFWAYHRMVDQHFQYLAPTVTQFLEQWLSGSIRL